MIAAPLLAAAVLAPGAASPSPPRALTLASASLRQRDGRMFLRLRTREPWVAAGRRHLCVDLGSGGRICVSGHARLTFGGRRLAARVRRTRRLVDAQFLPAGALLPVGPLRWEAWTDAGRLPARTLRVKLVGRPPCAGAAAWECTNPRLRGRVDPPARVWQPAVVPLCDRRSHVGLVAECSFGAPRPREQFALVGDSHAAAWKPALEVVTHALQWRGHSLLRSGCPPTTAAPILPTAQRSEQCRRWNREVRLWLARHPAVRTVFLTGRVSTRYAGSPVPGYLDEIAALPRSVRRVVVLRDTPTTSLSTLGCIRAAARRGTDPGAACPLSRPQPDALAQAAAQSPRAQVIDLTRYFCDAARCPSVLGGILVLHDTTHMTTEFATTLGPYLARALTD